MFVCLFRPDFSPEIKVAMVKPSMLKLNSSLLMFWPVEKKGLGQRLKFSEWARSRLEQSAVPFSY